MSNEMPFVSLSDVAANEPNSFVDGPFGSNLKSSEYVDQGVRLIQLQNIGDGYWIDDNQKFITHSKYETIRRHGALPGEIAIAKMAEPVARACLLPAVSDRFVVVADCIKLKPDTTRFDPRYVTYAINSLKTRLEAEKKSTGTTRLRINLSVLKTVNIWAPSLDEQRLIAEILDTLNHTIQKTEQLIAKLKQIKQGLLHDLLTRGIDENGQLRDPIAHPEQFKDSQLGRIPGSWDVVPIGAIGDVVTGSTPPSSAPDAWGELSPFVTPGEISEGSIARSERGLSKKGLAFVRMIPAGATLVVCIGSTLGKTAQASEECATNQQINAVIPSDTFDASYVYHAISAHIYQLFRIAGLQAVPIVNKSQFSKILVPLAPPVEQVRIAQIVRSQDGRLRAENKYLAKLNRLKKGLMHDLLIGKVRVNTDKEHG